VPRVCVQAGMHGLTGRQQHAESWFATGREGPESLRWLSRGCWALGSPKRSNRWQALHHDHCSGPVSLYLSTQSCKRCHFLDTTEGKFPSGHAGSRNNKNKNIPLTRISGSMDLFFHSPSRVPPKFSRGTLLKAAPLILFRLPMVQGDH